MLGIHVWKKKEIGVHNSQLRVAIRGLWDILANTAGSPEGLYAHTEKTMIDYQTRENADCEIIHDKTDTTTRQIARTMCSLEIRSGSHKRSIRRRSAGANLRIFSLTLSQLSYRGFCL